MATEQKEITDPCAKYNEQTSFLSKTIFASRWLQVPIYLGLIVVQGIYAYKFMKNLWYLITNVNEMDADTIMLAVLNLIDVVIRRLWDFRLKTTHEKSSGSTWMDEPCECDRAESQTFYVNYQHFLDSLIANLCECLKNFWKNDYVGSDYSFFFLDFSDCHGLYRQNSLQYKS